MEMLDYISKDAPYTEETQLHFERNDTISKEELIPLTCYSMVNNSWTMKEVPQESQRLTMGKNPYECDFKLNDIDADDVHVIIQKTGDSWFILDSGKKDLMKVNGFATRQLHLLQNQVALVQIGKEYYIFSTKEVVKKEDQVQSENEELAESQFSLNSNGISLNFNLNHICLIGSDPICDFYIPGEQFVAIISNLGKRLFLASLVDNSDTTIEVDGVSNESMPPLKPGTIINIGNTAINVKLSKDLRFTQSFNYIPDTKNECMKLLEIDALGNTGHGYILPAAGRSIKVGRNSKECAIVIGGSTKISRIHGQAIVYDKSLMLIDNNSTNGIYVNDDRIKRFLAHPGSFVKFGDVTFILCFA